MEVPRELGDKMLSYLETCSVSKQVAALLQEGTFLGRSFRQLAQQSVCLGRLAQQR